MTFWEWLERHGTTVAAAAVTACTFIGTVIIALLLWGRIGDVSSDVQSMRGEIATYRTSDSGRIDQIGSRLDAASLRLDSILDESKKNGEGIATILDRTQTQGERLNGIEKIVASGVTDMSVVLRLMSGDTSHLSLTNFATQTHRTVTEQAGIATVMVGAKLYRGGELRLYPPNPDVGEILKENGWQPASPDDPAQGFVFKP